VFRYNITMLTPEIPANGRRGFLRRVLTATGLAAAAPQSALPQNRTNTSSPPLLPAYARAQSYKSLKQSSYDRTGGNGDSWRIPSGGVREVFRAEGPGIVSHVWFTIAAQSDMHLKELVLRAWWDDNPKPSIETPIGDFFGLNLGSYFNYQSEYLACSPGKSLNCYFSMPYRKSARASTSPTKANATWARSIPISTT
jgi:hypothetical protein